MASSDAPVRRTNAPSPILCAFRKISLSPPIPSCDGAGMRAQRLSQHDCDEATLWRDEIWPSPRGSPKARPMQFLKTLFWVLLAVLVVLFASRNWSDVTLNLWGDIQADIKIPLLMLILFLLGLLPTWLIMRAKLW